MILRALKPSKKYDAIVVGSGTGGAPLALRLGERGLQVLVVEQGNFLKVARGPEVSPPGKFIVDVLGSRDAPLTFVGGRSKFYGAALYRFRESDCAVGASATDQSSVDTGVRRMSRKGHYLAPRRRLNRPSSSLTTFDPKSLVVN